jgi:hypothetical protein
MKHDQVSLDLQAPSVTLLRSDNAPLILSFLAQEFVDDVRSSLPLEVFIEHLERYLERLAEAHPNRYRDTARNYVGQWSDDKGWLRIYRPGSSPDYVVEMTTHAHHALSWMEDLQHREFLGTESRFAQILSLLNEIVVKSNSSIEERIQQLEQEQARIQREIERIQQTGQVEQFTPSQIRERFQLAAEQAGQLLRDFTTVEERFREIAHLVQQEQMKADARKGAIVGKVLDSDEQLRDSVVGRSFYAFWDYLQQPAQKDELYRLLETAFNLDEITPFAKQTPILRDMPRYLIEAGLKVDQSNQRLAEQLRRMLDEASVAESRRIRALVAEVRQLFGEYPDLIDADYGIRLESLPQANLVMERKLWSPKEDASFERADLETATITEFDSTFWNLVNSFYIDEAKIRERIELALDERSEISLFDLVQQHPVQQGLPEVLAYIKVAVQQEGQHHIDLNRLVELLIPTVHQPGEMWLRLRLPQIVFRSVRHG